MIENGIGVSGQGHGKNVGGVALRALLQKVNQPGAHPDLHVRAARQQRAKGSLCGRSHTLLLPFPLTHLVLIEGGVQLGIKDAAVNQTLVQVQDDAQAMVFFHASFVIVKSAVAGA